MSAAAVCALRDPELLELLAGEHELLALSDAIAATAPRQRVRRVPARLLLAAIVFALAAVFALVGPWSESRGGVVQRALAAVSGGSMLHVVLVSPFPDLVTIDLRTGTARPSTLRVETWFDAKRGLKRTLWTHDGSVVDETLATPQGVWSRAGRVPTCSWIAGHPVRATRLRVSCVASGRNGTAPRRIPEQRPTLDPAFGAFATGYKLALASGAARNLGKGRVGGRPVYWIGFTVAGARAGTPPTRERVAVDRTTFRPLLHQAVFRGKVVGQARVAEIGSIDFDRSLFKRPPLARTASPSGGSVVATRTVPLAVAADALGGKARSLGGRFAGLPLSDARIETLTTGYGPFSGRRVSRSAGVRFLYGDSAGVLDGRPYLRISESLGLAMAYRQTVEASRLAPGQLQLRRTQLEVTGATGQTLSSGRTLWTGELRAGRLHISLEASSRPVLVAAARALQGGG